MQNQKTLEVRSERLIQKPASEVFKALSEGRLFMNCGADSESMNLDFKVGGKYHIDFKSYEVSNTGEFLEIIPNQKIVFTWCTSFEKPLTPDTKVTIELFPDGNKTRLLLVHSGFKTEESRTDHEGGWTAGLNDLTTEIQEGKLRMVRVFEVPVKSLFEASKERLVKGEILESVPNKKIIFIEQSNKVTLTFDEEDDGGSSFELVHEGLNTGALLKAQRQGWESLCQAMKKTLHQ